jgi:hypothetical protein
MKKIEILDGEDGEERWVTGTYDLDGNNVYEWELDTQDGFTSINFKVAIGHGKIENVNLEAVEDYDTDLGLTEDEGYEIYEDILDFVNDNGYDFIGEDFE